MKTYKIIRFIKNGRMRKAIKTGLTRKEAQKHCQDPTTRGEDWFDDFQEE